MQEALRNVSRPIALFSVIAILVAGTATMTAQAAVWHADAGAQSTDKGKQALAFLSNELWIHVNDSVLWSFHTAEIHTITFLKPGQVRLPFQVGCPGTTLTGSSFTGAACVNSGPLTEGATYSVNFPAAGSFKLVCQVHVRMTGAIHVLNSSETLPHDQAFYDRQANEAKTELLSDASGLEGRANSASQQTSAHGVTAGISAISGNGGGSQEAAVMRFFGETTVVHVGDTVEWTNLAPAILHTVTFGTEPSDLTPPSPITIPVDSDGVRHAVISSLSDNVNSGFLISPNQETIGLPQWPLDVTRFRVTFAAPGTFNYFCAIHDNLGMVARVIVNK